MSKKRKIDVSWLLPVGISIAGVGYFFISKAKASVKGLVSDLEKSAKELAEEGVSVSASADVRHVIKLPDSETERASKLRDAGTKDEMEQRVISLNQQAEKKGYITRTQNEDLLRDIASNDYYRSKGRLDAAMNPEIATLALTILKKIADGEVALLYAYDVPYAAKIIKAKTDGYIGELEVAHMENSMQYAINYAKGKKEYGVEPTVSTKMAYRILSFINKYLKTGQVKIKVDPSHGTGFMTWKEWMDIHG